MKQSEKEFLELIVKFYSTITGIPEDYIKSNNIIKNHIDLESTESHFITSLKVMAIHADNQLQMLTKIEDMMSGSIFLPEIQKQIKDLEILKIALAQYF